MGMFGNSITSVLARPKFFRASHVRVNELSVSKQQLDTVLKEAEAVIWRSKNLVAGREQTELNASPAVGTWSVAQCFDHLTQTTNAFLPIIANAIAHAPRLSKNRCLKIGALTQLFIRNLEPPYRLRFTALESLVPRRADFQSVWSAFENSQAEFEKAIQSSRGLAIDKMKIKSPVYARLSYNVYGALCMLTAHQRRHLWQVEQILNALDHNR